MRLPFAPILWQTEVAHVATPTRPLLRYPGGKWRQAPKIIKWFPKHRIYVEPFGGGAGVLLQKEPAKVEVYNDIDEDVHQFFVVMRDLRTARELKRRLSLTPFCRRELELAHEATDDPVERARRTMVRSWMSFQPNAIFRRHTGFRTDVVSDNRYSPALDFRNMVDGLDAVIERLRTVAIERRDACDLIVKQDHPETLFYVDPPYVRGTRNEKPMYSHEMDDGDHIHLAATLHDVEGMVIVSGYASALYDEWLYKDWHRVEHNAVANTRKHELSRRTEVLWINDVCMEALGRPEQVSFLEGV